MIDIFSRSLCEDVYIVQIANGVFPLDGVKGDIHCFLKRLVVYLKPKGFLANRDSPWLGMKDVLSQ